MKTRAKGAHRRRGLTLIEVVLATGLLALGIGAVLGLLTFGAGLAGQAERRAQAAAALPAVVADLEERFFELDREGGVAAPAQPVERPVPGHPGLSYRARGAPLELPGPGGRELWRLEVELLWIQGGGEQALAFTTLLPRAVPFGERLRRRLFGETPPAGVTSPPR